MPNTPAMVMQGATGLYASPSTTLDQKKLAESVLSSVSVALYWVTSESLLDVVTAISGSGPAYFFLMMESMIDAGVGMGMPKDIATGLAIQTCIGAGVMARDGDVDVAELRNRVTSLYVRENNFVGMGLLMLRFKVPRPEG
jgi:pyrroline-5-carboxylate reductase